MPSAAVFVCDMQAVTKMVQKACDMLEKTPDKETKLKLIATLRTVTAGKVTQPPATFPIIMRWFLIQIAEHIGSVVKIEMLDSLIELNWT